MLSVDHHGKILVVKLLGEIDRAHLDEAEALIEEKLEGNTAPVLIDLRQYDGAQDLGTAWRQFKLVTTYGDRVEKIAVVGALDWQKLATLLTNPFTKAKERFFEPDAVDEALRWLRE